ncbi:hypothetical protein [Motilimonas sp. KMU-193]|uniref:hypothetical protein n=1 Tax=Motilimonas sp. KMU-193 TaxID=3388668 RepID=UPI00396B1EB8
MFILMGKKMPWIISVCVAAILAIYLFVSADKPEPNNDIDSIKSTPSEVAKAEAGVKTKALPDEKTVNTVVINEENDSSEHQAIDKPIVEDNHEQSQPEQVLSEPSQDQQKSAQTSVYDTFNQPHEAVEPVFLELIKKYGDGRFYRTFANYSVQDKPLESSELLEQQVAELIAQAPNRTSTYNIDCRIDYCIATFTLDSGSPEDFLWSFGGKNINPWDTMEVSLFVSDEPTKESVIFFAAGKRHILRGYNPILI